MMCRSCTASKAPVCGTPLPGYCDGCGWSLAICGNKPTDVLCQVDPLSFLIVEVVRAFENHGLRFGNERTVENEAIRGMAAEVQRRT